MTAWPTAALAQVARLEREMVSPDAIEDGTTYIGLEHVATGGEIVGASPISSGELKSTKFAFTCKHILYGKLRPYLAKIALPDFDGVCTTEMVPIAPGPRMDRRFLAHFLRQPEQIDLATTRSTGANLPRLSPSELAKFEVPVPPLPEQRRIAAILDEADTLRAKRRAALAQLDEMAQAIFLELFGDPAINPKNWPVKMFGDVCDILLGKMLDQKRQTGKCSYPYLRNANVRWFEFDTRNLLAMDFSPSDQERYKLLPGDILICEGGEPGRAAIWQGQIENCYFQKALHRARSDLRVAIPEYLVWVLWSLVQNGGLKDHVTVATIAHLTKEKLETLPIPIPPLMVQQDFATQARSIDQVRTSFLRSLNEVEMLFASLQHRAFIGEL